MKTPIEIKDIRKGDLIRVEYDYGTYRCAAIEYIAFCDNEYADPRAGFYYLLDRPVPPFEPHWGMVIGSLDEWTGRAVYLPDYKGDTVAWLTDEDSALRVGSWQTDDWAKKKLAEGWGVIEGPESVK